MKKSTIIIISAIIIATLSVVGFWQWEKEKNAAKQAKNQEQQQVNNQQSQQIPEDQLVWYEIPELGVRFLVNKEIASNIGYRDNYIESTKFGYRLYAKNYPKYPEITKLQADSNLDSFAIIASYDFKDGALSACPAYPTSGKPILKTDKRIICYLSDVLSQEFNKSEGIDQKFDLPTKKLFNDYLKDVPAEEIK